MFFALKICGDNARICIVMIDEKKVIDKSKSYGQGYKGVFPKFTFKRGATKNERLFDIARIVIGYFLILSFAFGTLYLIYTLLTEGESALATLKEEKHAPDHTDVQVIFKPSHSGEK